MVRAQITYNLDTSFHMLRHFSCLPDQLKEELLSKGYSIQQFEDSLTAPGSRFDAAFADSVDLLLDRVFVDSTYTESSGLNGNVLIHALARTDRFPDGVGDCGVVSKSALDEDSISKIFWKKNRGISLMHLDVLQLPRTGEYTLIFKPATGHYIFITAFPGPPAMPLPDRKMNANLFRRCVEFWDQHVFLTEL